MLDNIKHILHHLVPNIGAIKYVVSTIGPDMVWFYLIMLLIGAAAFLCALWRDGSAR